MAGRGGGNRKVLLPPINFVFKLLTQRNTVQIWLSEQISMRIEGKIQGFDEYMNLVLTDAVLVTQPSKDNPNPENPRRPMGQILVKGDNVSLIQTLD